jgi:putative ABC transport system substrate-binding protein
MRRRDFILLGSAVAWPLVAQAQILPKRRPLIGWLSGGTTEVVKPFAASFLDGMRELGYIEGRDFDMAYRFAEGLLDR